MHARGAIRIRVQQLLSKVDGLNDHIVFDDNDINADDELPWAWIVLGDEAIVPDTLKGRKRRTPDLRIILVARNRFALVERLEELARRIEDLIDGDPTLGGLVRPLQPRSLTIERSDESPLAAVILTYALTYRTAAGDAATPT